MIPVWTGKGREDREGRDRVTGKETEKGQETLSRQIRKRQGREIHEWEHMQQRSQQILVLGCGSKYSISSRYIGSLKANMGGGVSLITGVFVISTCTGTSSNLRIFHADLHFFYYMCVMVNNAKVDPAAAMCTCGHREGWTIEQVCCMQSWLALKKKMKSTQESARSP